MIIYALKLRAKTRAIALVALVLGPPLAGMVGGRNKEDDAHNHYRNGEILLMFLSSNKTLPLVITHRNLTRKHLVGKIYYTKF
jgi:hypothetical protein